jgi:hypothetical protein
VPPLPSSSRPRGADGALVRLVAPGVLAALMALMAGAGVLVAAPADASTDRAAVDSTRSGMPLADAPPEVDGSHPAELQPAPEDGQEQFGEPSDERTEELVRWLRTGLGVAVGIVILLLVIVVPLRLRNRETPEARDARPDAPTDDSER